MENNDNKTLMRATPEWMKENYDRFNRELFGGELGSCDFEIFTSGRGSQGRTLGRFKLSNRNIYVRRYDRSMYIESYYDQKNINRGNFAELCMPVIMLNGHYSATEEALQGTLVHEMVHYADYMYGTCPKQAHGPSFRRIASVVSARSNGMFTIQRLANAEEMSNYKLDDEMQARKDKRIENKKARALAIFVYRHDGRVEMTLVSNTNTRVPEEIYDYYKNDRNGKKKAVEIITSNDPELIEMLYQNGYRKLMRTWRYWSVESKPWVNDIKKYDYNSILKPGDIEESKGMGNGNNIHEIIESVIGEYVSNMGRDDIRIGDIDLELKSPLEGID